MLFYDEPSAHHFLNNISYYRLKGYWLDKPLSPVQTKKPFLIISTMVYLCNVVTPNHQIKSKILALFANNGNIPIYKLRFLNNWLNQGLWK